MDCKYKDAFWTLLKCVQVALFAQIISETADGLGVTRQIRNSCIPAWGKYHGCFCIPVCHPLSSGVIQEEYLRELLTTMGDRFTDEEVDELFREAPIDKKSNFNYVEFTRILKHGAKDKDD